jgi:hypothetical protein
VTRFEDALGALAHGGVDFVVVGGIAAVAHGASVGTSDLDVLYGRDLPNLDRLACVLAPFHPYLRGVPAGLPFALDVATLRRGLNFTLTTDLGDLDLLGEMLGVGGYDAALPRSLNVEIYGRHVRVVGLEDLVAAKRAAGRAKDLLVLGELETLLARGPTPRR